MVNDETPGLPAGERHLKLGLAHAMQGRLPEALADFQRAAQLAPEQAEAHFHCGNVLLALGRPAEAVTAFGRCLGVQPEVFEALAHRGVAFAAIGQHAAAVADFERALFLRPDAVPVQISLANSLGALGRHAEALAAFEAVIALEPGNRDALLNRGILLALAKRYEAAIASFDAVIGIAPDMEPAHYNRGLALLRLDRAEEAERSLARALQLLPDRVEAYVDRGIALSRQLRLDEAIASFDESIRRRPDFAPARWNRTVAFLLKGDLAEGWRNFEQRWHVEGAVLERREFRPAPWLGRTPLQDKTLLLYSDQGLGDMIQFARYAPLVARAGGRALLEADRALLGLLGRMDGVSALVAKGSPLPAFDLHIHILSLPVAFQTEVASIPGVSPYLSASPEKVAFWARKLGPKSRLRVGFVCSGNPRLADDRNRSIPLQDFLAAFPSGVDLISLHREFRAADEGVLQQNGRVQHFGLSLDSFEDTAAICELVDVVVSVDTSVAHLAGALGRPVWILLPFAPDWRWMLGRDDSPWYPSARLYRQAARHDWDPPLRRVRADLEELARRT